MSNRIKVIVAVVLMKGLVALAATSQPDPEMAQVLDALASLGPKPIETLTPAEARKQPTPADAVAKLLQQHGLSSAPEAVAKVENRAISGQGGEIPVRIYWPKGDAPFPVILYVHGGGWVIANLDTYDASARALTNAVQAVVVSTHYRQAPEHRYPAAHDDVFTAYRWVTQNAEDLGGDARRLAVAGESAGGNLAAAVSIRARDRDLTMPVHQLLIYPIAGTDTNTDSYRENAAAKPLSRPMMQWFLKHYLGEAWMKGNNEINLAARKDLKGLPPTTIVTADIDPLRSEGQMLARALTAAGVPVASRNFEGATHEFFGMGAVVPDAKEAMAFAAGELRKSFAAATDPMPRRREGTGTEGP